MIREGYPVLLAAWAQYEDHAAVSREGASADLWDTIFRVLKRATGASEEASIADATLTAETRAFISSVVELLQESDPAGWAPEPSQAVASLLAPTLPFADLLFLESVASATAPNQQLLDGFGAFDPPRQPCPV